MRDVKEYTILNDIGIKNAVFTAAVTDVITSAAHGLKNGDMVVLTTNGTLPLGLSVLTIYWVRDAATDTFKLSATADGPPVDITGATTDTDQFTMHDIGKNIFVADHRHALISVATDGGGDAEMVIKFVGSLGKSPASPEDCPDFSASASKTNMFDYLQIIDHQSGLAIAGDTGLVLGGADDNRQFMINVDGMEWLNAIISGWVAGEVTVRVMLFND